MKKMHELKTDPKHFSAVWDGKKTFELRFNDRKFQRGDILYLREIKYSHTEMDAGKPLVYTGREIISIVKHIMHDTPIMESFGLQTNWCIMSIKVLGTDHAF